LQQTSPTSHVFAPQNALIGYEAIPQFCRVHASPGETQIPHVALQQTSPGAQVVTPHGTGGADGAGGGVDGAATEAEGAARSAGAAEVIGSAGGADDATAAAASSSSATGSPSLVGASATTGARS
jgi:hypothetical protein